MADLITDYVSTGSFILLVVVFADLRFLHWRVSRLEISINGANATGIPYTLSSKRKRKGAKRKPNPPVCAMLKAASAIDVIRSARSAAPRRDEDTVNGFGPVDPLRRS